MMTVTFRNGVDVVHENVWVVSIEKDQLMLDGKVVATYDPATLSWTLKRNGPGYQVSITDIGSDPAG